MMDSCQTGSEKAFKTLIFLLLMLTPALTDAQKKNQVLAGGSFDFSKYISSSRNLYNEIPVEKIKSVRLEVREFSPENPSAAYLFNPAIPEKNSSASLIC